MNAQGKPKPRIFSIPYGHGDCLESFTSATFQIQPNPDPNGNYQFTVLANQMVNFGVFWPVCSIWGGHCKQITKTTHGTPIANYVACGSVLTKHEQCVNKAQVETTAL